MVYLIESRSGLVKIGYSFNPEYRLACIQPYSPCPLRVIAKWDAHQRDEYALHKRFSAFRVHHEWFEIVGALSDFVASRRGVGVEVIQDWPAARPDLWSEAA